MIDARMLIGRFSGVSRVVTRLVDELARHEEIEVVALCGDGVYGPWEGRTDIEIVRSSFGRGDRRIPRRVLWEETRLPGVVPAAGVDLFHATWNFGVPARCPVPSVLTIHDLIPWHREGRSGSALLHRTCYRYAVRSSARRATRLTTVSDYVRQEVINTLRVSPDRVAVVPNGVDIPTTGRCRGTVETKTYALYVGGHEPRKNVAGVFKAMQCYWRQYDPTLELRLTGREGSLSRDAATTYQRLPPNAPIRFLGDISDAELEEHYSSARVLLLLSHEEGFGLPALEAMAHGCPVVAADRASLPEVVGDAGLLVDPDRPEAVAAAVRSLITDPARRTDLVRRGECRARMFGWNVTASRFLAVYHAVLQDAGRPSADVIGRGAAGPADAIAAARTATAVT
jgi:alpha-1,3-rhamnosyl/mannosyltransferase